MTALGAIIQVLKSRTRPMTGEELTDEIFRRGLWSSDSETPIASITSTIYRDIKQNRSLSPFVKLGPNLFALKKNHKGTNDTKEAPAHSTRSPRTMPLHTDKKSDISSFADAAEYVLNTFGNGAPMKVMKVTELALHHGLIVTSGDTPWATMRTQIYREINKCKSNGTKSRFKLLEKNFVALTKAGCHESPALSRTPSSANFDDILCRLMRITPYDFELFIGRLLVALGYKDVEVTQRSRDGGVDVIGRIDTGLTSVPIVVQVKRWKANVQAPDVQKLRGCAGHSKCLIVTTSDFSEGAKKEASRGDAAHVDLVNGSQLVDLIRKCKLVIN